MEQARGTTVVAGGTLIDGTGAAPVADGAVVVTDGRIAFAGPEAAMPRCPPMRTGSTPAGARSCRG